MKRSKSDYAQKSKHLPAILGWTGFALVLGSYAAASFGWLEATTALALSLNIFGAALLGYAAFARKAYQPLTIYVVWVVAALVRMFI